LQVPKEYLEALQISGKASMEFDGETITIKAPKSLESKL
jgi:putative ABC transport system ATP-binding protein